MASIAIASWDVDGQASASMLIRSGYVDTVYFPPVGMYWIPEDMFDVLPNYEYIYIVDMHIPRRDVERLSRNSYVYLIDDSRLHPDYSGLKASCICYDSYSTTYVLMEYLGVEPDIDALLGMYHDVGDRVINNEYWDIFWKYLENLGLTLDDLKELVKLLNIPMYLGDVPSLYRNVDLLMNRLKGLDREGVAERLGEIERYIDEIVSKAVDVEGVRKVVYSGRYYVIIDVVKKMFQGVESALAVDTGFLPGYTMVAGASRRDLYPLVKKLLEKDLPAGGSRHFFGVVVEESCLDDVLNLVNHYLGVENESP